MSIKLMSLIWEDHTGELTGIEKAILLKLADHSSEDGMRIYPSFETLALNTGFGLRTIARNIKSLQDKGRIRRIRRRKKGVQTSNCYRINIKILEEKSKKSDVDKTQTRVSQWHSAECHSGTQQSVTVALKTSVVDPSVFNHKDITSEAPVDKSADNVFFEKEEERLLTTEEEYVYIYLISLKISPLVSKRAAKKLSISQINNIVEVYTQQYDKGLIKTNRTSYVGGALKNLLGESNTKVVQIK